ncbi:MAG: hypothetical protein WCT10_03960 [Patescibacteria group bacterium]
MDHLSETRQNDRDEQPRASLSDRRRARLDRLGDRLAMAKARLRTMSVWSAKEK